MAGCFEGGTLVTGGRGGTHVMGGRSRKGIDRRIYRLCPSKRRVIAHTIVSLPRQRTEHVRFFADQTGGRGVLDIMHGHSRMYDHRPLHPNNAGAEHFSSLPTRQTLLAPHEEGARVLIYCLPFSHSTIDHAPLQRRIFVACLESYGH